MDIECSQCFLTKDSDTKFIHKHTCPHCNKPICDQCFNFTPLCAELDFDALPFKPGK